VSHHLRSNPRRCSGVLTQVRGLCSCISIADRWLVCPCSQCPDILHCRWVLQRRLHLYVRHHFLPLSYPIDISRQVPKPSRPGWITVAQVTSGRYWTTIGRHSSAALTRLRLSIKCAYIRRGSTYSLTVTSSFLCTSPRSFEDSNTTQFVFLGQHYTLDTPRVKNGPTMDVPWPDTLKCTRDDPLPVSTRDVASLVHIHLHVP
jgi:hypothetical protein